MAAPHLGVLAGLRTEADLLIRSLPSDLPTTIRLSGARPELAHRAAEALVQGGATHLLSFGYAGGLDPALAPGTLLLPRSVIAPDGRSYVADGDWFDRLFAMLRPLAPVSGSQLGLDEALASPAEKALAFQRSRGAAGIDMESHALAVAADAQAVPFLVVRVILDSADQVLPRAAMASARPDGSISIPRLLAALLRRPSEIGELARLARAKRSAEARLLGCCSRAAASGFGVR